MFKGVSLRMNPYVLALKRREDLVDEFKKIGVDGGGIDIMLAKGFLRVVKLHGVRSPAANILKQEMLSLGGDAALSRGSITGRDKKTDCLLLGNCAQINRLYEKLKKQPWGLSQIGQEIKAVLAHFERDAPVLEISGKRFRIKDRTLVMGIMNVTADSFSGDGILGMEPKRAAAFAQEMVSGGADILDIGGQSSRPGSRGISAKEELARVLPVLKAVTRSVKVPVSIDTTKSEVARAALEHGVSIVNDISALSFDKKMAKVVAKAAASVILMHMKGRPRTMQKNPQYQDLMQEIISFLWNSIKKAQEEGIGIDKIIIDPGIGFGKTVNHNIEILQRLSALKSLGRPVLVGLSRKSFIGKILKQRVSTRGWGTAAALSLAIANGADIVRVHDVGEMKQVARVCDAIAG